MNVIVNPYYEFFALGLYDPSILFHSFPAVKASEGGRSQLEMI